MTQGRMLRRIPGPHRRRGRYLIPYNKKNYTQPLVRGAWHDGCYIGRWKEKIQEVMS